MKKVLLSFFLLGAIAFAGGAAAQDATPSQGAQQNPGGGMGQRGMRGGGMMGMGGRGLIGTVTAVAADHYTIKSDEGETWTVEFSVNTRIMHQSAWRQGEGGNRMGPGAAPPQALKSTDIKVGDQINALGETDSAKKSIGAVFILQLDPEAAQRMREMKANFGKTWLMGSVASIDGTKVTINSQVDGAVHTFVADENTTFRQRREPVTLGDVKTGDMVRVEGAVKDGKFVAAAVNVMGAPQGGPTTAPGNPPPPAQPK
jgi:hypothetical protein